MPTVCAARLRACQLWPCSSHAILSLTPIERPGLGTFAVDSKWRLYFDQEYLNTLDVNQAAAVILHEVCHCVLKHHKRFRSRVGENPTEEQRLRWNIAADFAVNDMLRAEGVTVRDGVFPEDKNYERGLSSEAYYGLLERAEQQPETYEEQGNESSNTDEGQAEPGSEGTESDSDASEGSGESDQGTGSGEGIGDEAGGGTGGMESVGGDDEHQTGSDTAEPGEGGSCADGIARPWEESAGDDDDEPGLKAHEQDIIVKKVAERIVAARGTGAGGSSLEWAKGVLTPKVDPRRAFLVHVKNAVELVTGQGDYSYRRPSRRSQPGQPLPSSFAPMPRITVIVDTSGSMDERDLKLAMGLIGKVLNSLSCRDGVKVICGDEQVGSAKQVFRVSQICPVGGGGTDMDALIVAAMQEKVKPQLVIVATDGITPWPEKAVGVPVVAAITRAECSYYPVPGWIKKVFIN